MIGVINKLLVQLSVIVLSAMLLISCTGREKADVVTAQSDHNIDPLPIGSSVFAEINEPFFVRPKRTSEEIEGKADLPDNLYLYSYAPPGADQSSSAISQILNADTSIVVPLNTSHDGEGRTEVSILVQNDSVYKVDHVTNEIRLLNHFKNRVCEVIPVEIVDPSTRTEPDEFNFTVIHGDYVYVMTSDGDGTLSAEDCTNDNNFKRYYKLPLNYQFGSIEEDDSTTDELTPVSEALALSQFLFGWLDDPNQAGELILKYGYLGYSGVEQRLNFYDQDSVLQWSQERVLESFPVVDLGTGAYSDKYLFELTHLKPSHYSKQTQDQSSEQKKLQFLKQHYMLQLGLDLFVFDSGSELFSKSFGDVDSVLVDRIHKVSVTNFTSINKRRVSEIVTVATTLFDDDDLLIIDDAKIYNYSYGASVVEPNQKYEITYPKHVTINDIGYQEKRPFSQFDIKLCGDDVACQAAHDLELSTWQFIADCSATDGCSSDLVMDDYCETVAEKLITQSNETLCTSSNYLHLSELNDSGNDAEFRGDMQYLEDYINDIELLLHDDSLFITARMKEKEILLRYFYHKEFSDSKLDREQVLFGTRADMHGLDAYLSNDNLFLNALVPSLTRINECYRNYQKVSCNLGETVENGPQSGCTGKDLKDGLCVNEFREYESKALFCTAEQLSNQTCNDSDLSQIDAFAKEGEADDGKWIQLRDMTAGTISSDDMPSWLALSDKTVSDVDASSMYLLAGNHQAALNAGVLNEGVLLNPFLSPVIETSGLVGEPISTISGQVELVIGGWIMRGGETNKADVLGQLDIVSEEVIQIGGTSTSVSQIEKYFLIDSEIDLPSLEKVGDFETQRPRTDDELIEDLSL